MIEYTKYDLVTGRVMQIGKTSLSIEDVETEGFGVFEGKVEDGKYFDVNTGLPIARPLNPSRAA